MRTTCDGTEGRNATALAAATWLRRASACLRPDCTDCGLGRVRSRRKPDHRPPERFVAGSRDLVGRSQRGGDHRADRHRPADAPAAPARRAAEARPRLSRRGAFALPDGAGRGHDRRARGTTRRCARGRRGGDARRGRGAPARLRRGAERARQGDTRTFRARTRVLADDREGAPPGPRGRRSPQLGGAAARHRQARGARARSSTSRGGRRTRNGRRSGATPSWADSSPSRCGRGSASGRTPSPTITSAGTEPATRRASRARTSRSRAASWPSPTCSTS